MDYTLKIIAENNVNRYLLCDCNQNYYAINKLLYDILHEYSVTPNSREICENINKKRSNNFITESYIEQSLEQAKAFIVKNNLPVVDKRKYIKHKITLIKEGKLQKTYAILTLLFNKLFFVTLSVLSIALSFNFFYKAGYSNLSLLYNNLITSSSVANISVAFICSLIIVLIHEIGHATAAFKYKIQPKEIGAGFYFIFPVLYTNVTNVWNLPKLKRMMVNLGGIYFQLIINIFLIIFFSIGFFNEISLLLLAFNTISILISLNPFFRYDGYWLFSDWFGISNLREKSTTFITNAINYPTKIKNYIELNNIKQSTIIYSILNIFFWGWVYFSITSYLIENIPKLFSSFFIKDHFTIKYFGTLFNCFLITVWIITAIKTIYITFLKNNNHAKQ